MSNCVVFFRYRINHSYRKEAPMSKCFTNDYECKVQKIRLAAFSRYGIEVVDYKQFRGLYGDPDCGLDKDKDHWIFKHSGCFCNGMVPGDSWNTDPLFWKLLWRKAGENICSHTLFFLDEDITDKLIKTRFAEMECSEKHFREDLVEGLAKKGLSVALKEKRKPEARTIDEVVHELFNTGETK